MLEDLPPWQRKLAPWLLSLDSEKVSKIYIFIFLISALLQETDCWSRIRNDFLSKANDPSEEDPPACMEEMVLKLVDKLDKIKDGLEIKIQVSGDVILHKLKT